MRTISAELNTAQRAQANTPYVRIQLSKPDGSDVDTYATDDGTNRIIRVRASEELYGGALFEVSGASGLPIPIACQIILNNNDNVVSAIDYRGYKAMVGWGFESYVDGAGATQAIAGTKYSEGEPFSIFSQREHTSPGVNVTELWGISQWYMLEFRKIMGASLGDVYRNTDGKVRHLLIDSVTTDPDKVFTYDNSTTTYYDETTDAGNETADFTAFVDSSDLLFVGDSKVFDRITLEVTSVASWDGSHEYQYWNGSAWTALSDVVDGSSNWESLGVFTVSFTMPSNWVKRTVNGSEQYYVRASPTVWNSRTNDATINRVGVSNIMGMELGTSDSKEDTVAPNYAATQETSRREIVREMLDHTFSAFVARDKYFYLDQLNTLVDYSFDIDGDHGFYTDVRERTVVVPNAITVVNVLNDAGSAITQRSGSTSHTSNVFHDDVMEIIADDTIVSDDAAGKRAVNRLNRYLEETYQGEVSVPMQISLEPWDWVETVDDRLSLTMTGRLGRIIREFDPRLGVYRAQMSMGNNKALPPDLALPPFSEATKALQKLIQDRFAESTNQLRLGTQEREDLGFNIEANARNIEDRRALASHELELGIVTSTSKEALPPSNPADPEADIEYFANRLSRWEGSKRLSDSVNRLREFSQASAASPSEAVESGLPFWRGLPRSESSGYSSPKYATYSGSSGVFNRDAVVNTLRFRDFVAGGYNDVLMYNGGDGTFYIEEVGSGTAVTLFDLKGDLLPNADSTYDLGKTGAVWAEAWIDKLDSDGDIKVATNFLPNGDVVENLGGVNNHWNIVYADIVILDHFIARGIGTEITMQDHLVSHFDGGSNLGSASNRWGALHVDDIQHEGANLGFFGTTPTTKQTGVAVTAAGIHAALVNYGLITGP